MSDGKVSVGLWVRLEAKSGQEEAVAAFLKSALPLAQAETDTATWYAVRLGPSTFGVFDSFANEQGRKAHLSGPIAKALGEKAAELFAKPPQIEQVEILAVK